MTTTAFSDIFITIYYYYLLLLLLYYNMCSDQNYLLSCIALCEQVLQILLCVSLSVCLLYENVVKQI